MGLGELVEEYLTDARAKNARSPFADLLRQSLSTRQARREDVNNAERLCHGSTIRLIGPERILDRGAALTLWFETFEIELLAEQENFVGVARLNRARLGKSENDGSKLPGRAGRELHRDLCVRRARAERQQHALRVHLLSPAAAVQRRRRLSGIHAAARPSTLR